MNNFRNISDVLDFAIGEEQAAIDFYMLLAAHAKSDRTRTILHEFAEEEIRHKAKLMDIRERGTFQVPEEKVKDLKIAEYLVDVVPTPDMPYPDALILAMKKEKVAFRMYSDLAGQTTDPALKNLFLQLAREESRHKLRFEIEYDEVVLREN